MESWRHSVDALLGLGLEPKDLTFSQISLRAIVVFAVALTVVRWADKRFLSKKTAFDAILGFILASMLARAVNGSAAFWPTLGAGFVLVALHRIAAFFSRRSHKIGWLIKGSHELVIQEGKIVEQGLRKNNLSQRDLLEDLRLNGRVEDPSRVKVAYVERNGDISVVPYQTEAVPLNRPSQKEQR